RESQRRRFASVEVVDEIINLDQEWSIQVGKSPQRSQQDQ
ncbi:hypothetical protein A2U01_0083550, partial [Trifolium medium]|nr:hypothetical protein [Trifolium medium]